MEKYGRTCDSLNKCLTARTNDSEPNLERMYDEARTNAVLRRYQAEEQEKVVRPRLYTYAKS